MQLNLMKSKLPEATGKFQKLPSKSCIKSCSNLGALLQQSCGKPCSTLAKSLEANIAAFLQQPCNNLAAIILKQCRGRAILQQTLNQAFLQHSYNNFAASSTIRQKHKNLSQNTLKIGPDPAKIGAKSTPGTLLGAHRTKSPIFCT